MIVQRFLIVIVMLFAGNVCTFAASKTNLDKGIKAYNDEQYDAALAFFSKVLKSDPTNGYAWAFVASIEQFNKNNEVAFEAAQNALKHLPSSDKVFLAWTHSETARICAAMGDTATAIAELDLSIDLQPKSPDYYEYRAKLYQQSERLVEAENDYNVMMSLEPEGIVGLIGLGCVQGSAGKHEQAYDTFTKAVDKAPDDYMSYSYRSTELFNLKRYAEGMDDVIKALSLKENEEHALWVLPYIAQQDRAMVISKLEAQVEADPDRAAYWNSIIEKVK